MRNAIIAISIFAATAAASAAEGHDANGLLRGAAPVQNVFAEPNQIAGLLQTEGYVAKIDKDQDDDPTVRSSSQRAKWSIYFYGCSKHINCKAVQLHSSFTTQGKVSLDQVNTWNRTQRFATAVLDKDGDVTIKMDVHLGAGVSEDAFKNDLGVWDSQLGEFLKYIGW